MAVEQQTSDKSLLKTATHWSILDQPATQKIFFSVIKIYLFTSLCNAKFSLAFDVMNGCDERFPWRSFEAAEENFIAASKTWNFPISNSRFSFDLMDE